MNNKFMIFVVVVVVVVVIILLNMPGEKPHFK
jgi:hypothetical protein